MIPKSICFNGCSFTFGEGFSQTERDRYTYDRLVAAQLRCDQDNISLPGSSNYLCFMRSCRAIISQKYDLVITQWTALNRIWVFPGPDTGYFTNDVKHPDYRYRDLYLSEKEKKKFNETLLIMNHDYRNIMDLVDYCAVLGSLADHYNVKLIHINGLVPWQRDLLNRSIDNLEKDLSDYTKQILDFANRQDHEVLSFFLDLQNKFLELDQTKWINLFESWQNNLLDFASDGSHPGILSHRRMADCVIKHIKNM